MQKLTVIVMQKLTVYYTVISLYIFEGSRKLYLIYYVLKLIQEKLVN